METAVKESQTFATCRRRLSSGPIPLCSFLSHRSDMADATDRIDDRIQIRARSFPGDPTHTRKIWCGGQLACLVSSRASGAVKIVLLCPRADAFLSVRADVGVDSFEGRNRFETGRNQGTTRRNRKTAAIATDRGYPQRQEYSETARCCQYELRVFCKTTSLLSVSPFTHLSVRGMIFSSSHGWVAQYSRVGPSR